MQFAYAHDEQQGLDRVVGLGLDLSVRRLGAEAIGLTWKGSSRGPVGLLWRNGQTGDPESGWRNHAPILFPIVGGLHDNRSRTRDGKPVRFNRLHGFARESVFEIAEAGEKDDHFLLHYHLTDSEVTRSQYPWRFSLDVFYRLFTDCLEQALTVTNRSGEPMPYQIGWHPGFNAPFIEGVKSGCHLVLPRGRAVRMLNDENCFLTGETRDVGLGGDYPLDERELDRTYMFDFANTPPGERAAELMDPSGGFGVRVRFPDYPHLGLWSDAGAPFICIEPWQGMDDSVRQESFDEKFGIRVLPAGESDHRCASIEVLT